MGTIRKSQIKRLEIKHTNRGRTPSMDSLADST